VVSRNRPIARSGDMDWVDPLVGFRVRHQLAPGQGLVFRADVGGFDAGSQFSWNVLAAYSFTFAVRNGVTYAGLLGYRALSVEYEKGSGVNRYEYDVVQHGPVVGLTVGFCSSGRKGHLGRLAFLTRTSTTTSARGIAARHQKLSLKPRPIPWLSGLPVFPAVIVLCVNTTAVIDLQSNSGGDLWVL
jgi:hypothetical protein